jgi:hypothetical protein
MILSICINSKNRTEFISQTINSFGNFLNENIELIILDCSDSFQEINFKSNFIKHYKGDPSYGIDEGYFQVATLAKGDYIWYMTDDDLVYENKLDQIVKNLENDVDLLVLNSEIYDNKMNIILENSFPNFNNKSELVKIINLNEVIDILSYVGSIVVKRKIILENNNTTFYGTMFNHVYTIINSKTNKILLLQDPIIKIRAGNAKWTLKAFKIWNIYWEQVKCFMINYEIVEEKNINIKTVNLIYYFCIGAISQKDIFDLLKNKKIFIQLLLNIILFLPKNYINRIIYYYFIITNNFKLNQPAFYVNQYYEKNKKL